MASLLSPPDYLPIFATPQQGQNWQNYAPASTLDTDRVRRYFEAEFGCPAIEGLYPHMQWVARRSGSHIDSLHENVLKGRHIVLTEDAGLHLIWHKKTILLKPLPLWLLPPSFQNAHIHAALKCDSIAAAQAARIVAGFIRSYTRLIRHESDFTLAIESGLLPRDGPSFAEFMCLMMPFSSLADSDVSPRYHYGQIRLSRLNWATRVFRPPNRRKGGFLGSFYYHQLYWDTSDLIQAATAPFVFVFATLSVILSAMQVMLGAQADENGQRDAFTAASWGFSIFTLVVILLFLVLFGLTVGIVLCNQLYWSWRRNVR